MVCWKRTVLAFTASPALLVATNVTWAANPLKDSSGGGSLSQTSPPGMLNDKYTMPRNMTEKQTKEWVKKMEHEVFEKSLTKEEYIERNWMWLRCRCHHTPKFDVGGTWPGFYGEEVKKIVQNKCGYSKFKFKYVNGLDWGDGVMDMFPIARCTLRDTVLLLQKIAKRNEAMYHRNLYLWDCPYFEDERYYRTERDGLGAWPGPMVVPVGPLEKPEKRPGSWPGKSVDN